METNTPADILALAGYISLLFLRNLIIGYLERGTEKEVLKFVLGEMMMEDVFDKLELPTPPMIFGEICMCFDHDFDMELIDSTIGIRPSEAMRKSKTMFNAITGDNNPGYWSYKTSCLYTFECGEVISEIDRILADYYDRFLEVFHKYNPSDLIIRIWVGVKESGEYPAIRFEEETIKMLSLMGAKIDIILYNDYLELEDDM